LEERKFNSTAFIEEQTIELTKSLGNEKAIIACSGGVDSTTCAVLTRRAIGDNLICVFIDTNFMRLGEAERVATRLSSLPLELPIRVIQAQKRFLTALQKLTDAEQKRKAFRNTFYSVLSEVAKEEKCQVLVQGTILPDILETVKGIKTQHNVLEQMKINTRVQYGFKVIEPLVSLYKPQVRAVARCLGIPVDTADRQPFPGPGLSVRVVGEITPAKLLVEKEATAIVEPELEMLKPKQFFPVTIDANKARYSLKKEVEKAVVNLLTDRKVSVQTQTLETRATGIRGGSRLYGRIVTLDVFDNRSNCVELPYTEIESIQKKITDIDEEASRVLYRLTEKQKKGKWVIAIRAVETTDFVTAAVFHIPWTILRNVSAQILKTCKEVTAVYYDITPKPPASIEFE
jgi:GMP synthase (glutamine-hydrolysing)